MEKAARARGFEEGSEEFVWLSLISARTIEPLIDIHITHFGPHCRTEMRTRAHITEMRTRAHITRAHITRAHITKAHITVSARTIELRPLRLRPCWAYPAPCVSVPEDLPR